MSSKQFKRTATADLDVLQQYRGIRTTQWVKPPSGKSVLEIQTTHTPRELQKVPEGKNYLTPPYHCTCFKQCKVSKTGMAYNEKGHWYQDEYFKVTEGRYIFTLEGKDTTVSASDPQPVRIPATARHTFKVDDTHDGLCTVEISADAVPGSVEDEDVGINSKFFRNIYTYLDDCYLQNVEPSLPQLLLMLHSAEVSLAFPGPAWLMRQVSYAMGVVVGQWYGGRWLGLKSSYPEYWNEELESKKRR
nr:hypothetical protein B0A51_02037 [Rachicladosporium sp. CCFEE 5018]